jgi:catechol 2,3-dioxygenase-like lactoylglutathione lyase family enzyme
VTAEWFARPILFVADIERSLDFYVGRLGFKEAWRHQREVAQVDRQGCSLIFSSQWPDKTSNGLTFVSLNLDAQADDLSAAVSAALDGLRAEFESKGVEVRDGWWGYRLLVVRDPDGNELYFNYPDAGEPPAPTSSA